MSDDTPDDEGGRADDGDSASTDANGEARPAKPSSPKRRKKARGATPRARAARRVEPGSGDADEPDADESDDEPDERVPDAVAPPLDDEGRERPLFVLGFPQHAELDELVAAFEAGDYADVRQRAPELAARTDDSAVRAAALELRRRIDPDPLAKYLLLAAVTLLAFLSLWAYSHGH